MPWAYIRAKDKFVGPIFGRSLYSVGKTLQFTIYETFVCFPDFLINSSHILYE